MKISAFPKCWIEELVSGKMPLMKWIDLSTMLSCEGLELMLSFLQEDTGAYREKIRNEIEARGMEVSMVCYSPDFTVKDRDRLKTEIEGQKEAIRKTAELGCKYCRTLSGQKRPGLDTDQTIRQVVYAIESCLPTAEEYGVYLVMENHYKDSFWEYSEFAQATDRFLAIVERIQSPWFGVQYDPSNSLVAGEDPLELLDLVLPRVKTMHASDRYLVSGCRLEDVLASIAKTGYPEGLLHGVTGRGLNDYDAIFQRLRSINFDGWISIEDGMNGMEDMEASVKFLKAMRKKYWD